MSWCLCAMNMIFDGCTSRIQIHRSAPTHHRTYRQVFQSQCSLLTTSHRRFRTQYILHSTDLNLSGFRTFLESRNRCRIGLAESPGLKAISI